MTTATTLVEVMMAGERERILMQKVRERLAMAAWCERAGLIELADAYGAMAANKLAQVVRMAPVYKFRKDEQS